MTVQVRFYSYFKELTGTEQAFQDLPQGATIAELYRQLILRFPKLESMRKSTLIAVGVEYQGQDYILKAGEEVSLFPPVQGG